MATDGPRFPGTTANLSNAGSSENTDAWVNPGNVAADDATEASITAASYDTPDISQILVCSNFGFAIPAGATIDGILVEIDRRSIIASSGKDFRVQLAKGTTFASLVGNNKAVPATIWPTTSTVASYGSTSDLWGTTWTDSEINASSFAVMISCQANIANADVGIDYVRITVTYTAGPAKTGSETPAGTEAITVIGSYVPTDAAAGADVSNRVSDRSVALVVGNDLALTNGDRVIRDRLIGLGYTVFAVDDAAAADTTRDLVVIAESCSGATVGTKYRNVTMPVVVFERAIVLSMDFATADATNADADNENAVTILDTAHGMAGGLTGTVQVQSPGDRVDYNNASELAASAQQVYSTEASSTQIAGYGYDTGATMQNSHVAEARRVWCGLGGDAALSSLDFDGGATLIDASITWAAGVASTPKSGADPGSGTDASAETATFALTDVGTGSDIAAQGAVAPVTAEAGSGTDAGAVTVPTPATGDSASGTEARTETVSLPRSETSTGADVSTQTATAPATADAGSGSDAGTAAAIAATSPETGSGADASSEAAVNARTDAAAGTDVSSAAAAMVATEAGAGADSSIANTGTSFTSPESGTSSDASTQAAALAGAEAGAGADVSTEGFATVRADAAAGADASTVTQGAVNLQGAEAGSGADASAFAAAISTGEPATASDSASVVVIAQRVDSGASSDASAIERLYRQSETGVGAELAAMTAKFVGTDVGLGTDGSTRVGGRFIQMVRAMLAAAVPGARQEQSDSEPPIFRPGTLYVWEEDDRRSPASQGRQDFIVRAVYIANDRGERAGLPRSREATIELDAAAAAMLDAVRLAYAGGVWEYASATVDPTVARAYGVRGIGLRIAGYRLL